MPVSGRVALLLFLLALPAPRHLGDDAETAPFLTAILRRDGIVIPFAAFDGKNWTAPWPMEIGDEDPPEALQKVPRGWWGKPGIVEGLTAWANGVSRGAIRLHLGRIAVLHVMCDRRFGLASDYKSPEGLPLDPEQPYPKDGLAVSGEQRVDPIQVVAPDAPQWSAAAREMTVDFDEAEEHAAHTFTDWKHPFSKVQRRQFLPRIEAMYSAPMDEDGWTAYYLEAVRLYPPAPDDRGCGLVTSASGWMAVGPNGKRSFDLRARITYCDRHGVQYMLPLGLIKARDRNYWVYQMSTYGRESYIVARPRPKEIVTAVQYAAGTCPF